MQMPHDEILEYFNMCFLGNWEVLVSLMMPEQQALSQIRITGAPWLTFSITRGWLCLGVVDRRAYANGGPAHGFASVGWRAAGNRYALQHLKFCPVAVRPPSLSLTLVCGFAEQDGLPNTAGSVAGWDWR